MVFDADPLPGQTLWSWRDLRINHWVVTLIGEDSNPKIVVHNRVERRYRCCGLRAAGPRFEEISLSGPGVARCQP